MQGMTLLPQLQSTTNSDSKLMVNLEQLVSRVQLSLKELEELMLVLVPVEENSDQPLQNLINKLAAKNEWSWVFDQRCKRTLEKLDMLAEKAQDVLHFETVDPVSNTHLVAIAHSRANQPRVQVASVSIFDMSNVDKLRSSLSSSISYTLFVLGKRVDLIKVAKQMRMLEYKMEAKLDKQGIYETLGEIKVRGL